jgi:hypothetical protein
MAKFGLVRAAGYHMGLTKGDYKGLFLWGIIKRHFMQPNYHVLLQSSAFKFFIHLHEKKLTIIIITI